MKLLIKDLQELRVSGSSKPMIRFSVTLTSDVGEAYWTCQGWRLTQERKVLPPGTMSRFGKVMTRFNQITPAFEEMLKQALAANFPAIEEILGASLGDLEPVAGDPRFEGEGRVL
jgi:hypothetical protein